MNDAPDCEDCGEWMELKTSVVIVERNTYLFQCQKCGKWTTK